MNKHDKQNKDTQLVITNVLDSIDIRDPKTTNGSHSLRHSSEHHHTSNSHKQCCICDLCDTIKADPTDIERNGGRLISVKITVTNVCYDKQIYVACIIYDRCDRIVAFKGFKAKLCNESESIKKECGTIERKLLFVLPDDEIFDPKELEVKTLANYIYPCE